MVLTDRQVDAVAVFLGASMTLAGVMHFVSPGFFDAIVPPWLPPGERFWTWSSGIAELVIGPTLVIRRTRRIGALFAIGLYVAVYPANLYMAWDWRDEPITRQLVAWIRLPFQFLFIWLAWRVHRQTTTPLGAEGAPRS